jgi:hypothetical protein
MSSANYRNKYMRQRAIEAIMQAMGREEFGVNEVKIKNIRQGITKKCRRSTKAKHQVLPPTMYTSQR